MSELGLFISRLRPEGHYILLESFLLFSNVVLWGLQTELNFKFCRTLGRETDLQRDVLNLGPLRAKTYRGLKLPIFGWFYDFATQVRISSEGKKAIDK